MHDIRPVANGLRTDHPVPGLPFINDERLPLGNPDAIERTGRNQGEGLWGRSDSLPGGGWVAFTTEPKNRAYAWAVYYHPEHGRTVLLIHDEDLGDLHHDWMYGGRGFLYRHGGYWWDGTAWHRPGLVVDRAFERYDPRPVRGATTVTAADLLAHPTTPANARVTKIADFSALKALLPDWGDHLALWAQQRHRWPDSRPLDECVIDLQAPELEPDRLVDRVGLAEIADVPLGDLPHPERDRGDLPAPQADTASGPRWSQPVASDWAEQHRQTHGAEALLAGTTTFGTTQPRGLIDAHNRLTEIIRDRLSRPDTKKGKQRFAQKDEKQAQDTAATLAWWPAVAFTQGPNSLFPVSALRTTLIEAVISGLAYDVERAKAWGKEETSLGDIKTDVMNLLDWYIQRQPGHTAGLLGEICLTARTRLELAPDKVGRLIRRSLHLDSTLDGKTINTLLDMTLPPSAKNASDR